MRHKWQSSGALGADQQEVAELYGLTTAKNQAKNSSAGASLGFGRLKKSYATMRKSFRLQLASGNSSTDHQGQSQHQQQDQQQLTTNPSQSATNHGYAEIGADDYECSYELANETENTNQRKKQLIKQLGFGAAKLLRGVYSKGRRANQQHQLEMESIEQSTDGSFKVLSTMHSNYSDLAATSSNCSPINTNSNNGQVVGGCGQLQQAAAEAGLEATHLGAAAAAAASSSSSAARLARKSDLELEIERRLQRSKGRVLPSASYRAPDSDKACEGLNMAELEEIKRDNLRLRLRAPKAPSAAGPTSATSDQQGVEGAPSNQQHQAKAQNIPGQLEELNNNSKLGGRDSAGQSEPSGCSCKRLEVLDCDEDREQQQHHYCSCAFVASAGSRESIELLAARAVDGNKLNDDETSPRLPAASFSGRRVGSERGSTLTARRPGLPAAAVTQSNRNGHRQESTSNQQQQFPSNCDQCDQPRESRASDGFVGEGIEDKLRKMFDSMGEFGFKADCDHDRSGSEKNATRNGPASARCASLTRRRKSATTKQLLQDSRLLDFYQEPTRATQQAVNTAKADRDDNEKGEERAAHNCCSLGGASLQHKQRDQQQQKRASCNCGGMQTSERGNKCDQQPLLLFNNTAQTAAAKSQTATATPLAAQTSKSKRDAIELDTGQQQQQFACSTSGQQQAASKSAPTNSNSKQSNLGQNQRRHRTLTDGIRPFDMLEEDRNLNSRNIEQHPESSATGKSLVRVNSDDQERGEHDNLQGEEYQEQQERNDTLRLTSRRRERRDELQQKSSMMLAEAELWPVNNIRQQSVGYPTASSATVEEHLYASIRGSASPSPERPLRLASQRQPAISDFFLNHNQGQQQRVWQQQDEEEEDEEEDEYGYYRFVEQRQLFDKQLNNSHHRHLLTEPSERKQQIYQQRHQQLREHQNQLYQANLLLDPVQLQQQLMAAKGARSKKSLLSRLKQLLAPTSNQANQKQPQLKRGQQQEQVTRTVDDTWPPMPAVLDSKQQKSTRKQRWQKSATLTSKSTQNLLGSSLRQYLAASRKSVNLLGLEAGDEERAYARKSLVSGFLTLGRKSQVASSVSGSNGNAAASRSGKHELISQIFNDQRRQRCFGSADSLPSADSGLSCSNLQTNSSSCDENYPVNLMMRASSNLYTRLGDPLAGDQNGNSGQAQSNAANNSCDDQNHHQNDNDNKALCRPIVGRARAKVDCNPCAYDKEALVFKRGDLIDILERNQSGTWVGQCGQQVGHFKFINVSEISLSPCDDDDDGQDDAAEDAALGGGSSVRPANCGGVFVTKLEIRSNHEQFQQKSTNSRGQQLAERDVSDDEESSMAAFKRSATLDRRSLSAGTISKQDKHQQQKATVAAATGQLNLASQQQQQPLGDSNETIMSSLEQLLFAIGLAGEQPVASSCEGGSNCRNKKVNDNDGSQEQEGEKLDELEEASNDERAHLACSSLSYLDVLNRGGINNLDSFSAIDDLHELEQIGIVDEEHRCRLLMAARIIRQASRAAKQNFVQNYRIRSTADGCATATTAEAINGHSTTETTKCCRKMTPDSNNIGQALMANAGPATTSARQQQLRYNPTKQGKKVEGASGSLNEPIYVNLVDVLQEEGAASIVKNQRGKVHDLDSVTAFEQQQARRWQQHEFLPHQSKAQLSSAADCQLHQQQHYRAAFERNQRRGNSNQTHASSQPVRPTREGNVDSIIQHDHYHTSRCLSTQQGPGVSQDISTLSSSLVPGVEYDVHEINRQQRPRTHGMQIHSQNSFANHHHHNQDEDEKAYDNDDELAGNSTSGHSSQPLTRGYSVKINHHHGSSSNNNKRHSTFEGFSQMHDLNNKCSGYRNNGVEERPLQQQHKPQKQQQPQQQKDITMNLRSQINSTSAYDLRLDLSHFFS